MINFIEVKQKQEVSTVAFLADEIWNEHYSSIISQNQIDYMITNFQSEKAIGEQISSKSKYFIVKQHDQLVGYFAINTDQNYNNIQLSKLYVRNKAQRSGVGKSIITHINTYCLNNGIKKLWLTVNRYNYQAINFYLKNGFKKTDCIVQDIGNGFVMDDYKMEKTLNIYPN